MIDTSRFGFDLAGKVAVVTGGAGVLCAEMCRGLSHAGAGIAVLDLNSSAAERLAGEICFAGGEAVGLCCDVLDRNSLECAAREIIERFKRVDILINGAGGNKPQATTDSDQSFFELSPDALRWVFDLNLIGTILPSQVFGRIMAGQKCGVILNISSMKPFLIERSACDFAQAMPPPRTDPSTSSG